VPGVERVPLGSSCRGGYQRRAPYLRQRVGRPPSQEVELVVQLGEVALFGGDLGGEVGGAQGESFGIRSNGRSAAGPRRTIKYPAFGAPMEVER